MKKHRKYLLVSAFLFTVIIAVLYIVIYIVAPYSPIKPFRVHPALQKDTLHAKLDEFNVKADDNVLLQGYFIHSNKKPVSGTIIILHGIGDSKESQVNLAQILADSGFNAVVFDLRAHGRSGGSYCTYGYYEKKDVSRYVDEILSRYPECGPIGIMGHSLGGAVAIQSLAYDKRIKCGAISSTFANLREIVYDYMVRMSHVPLHFISNMALNNSEKIARFPVDTINPEDYAEKIDQPVLLMHGTADKNISIEYGRRIFKRLSSGKKQWHEVKGAGHNDIIETEGKEYYNRVIGYLKANMKSE